MKIIARSRGQGKTTLIIEEAAKTYSYIVCIDYEEARRIAKQAQEMGLSIPFPLTFHEFENLGFYPAGVDGFCIDNADLLFQRLLSQYARGRPVNAISYTPPTEDRQ